MEVRVSAHDRVEPSGEPIAEWPPEHDRPWTMRLYGTPTGFGVWIDALGLFEIEPTVPRITVPATEDEVEREERLWGLPAMLCFLERGDVSLHAAAVEIDDGALLMAGPGRFGKTTLAAAFLAAGYRVLSEDMNCCRIRNEPLLFPGPAVLRIRRDVYPHISIPNAHVVAEDRFRVHLALDESVRGDGRPVPIRAVAFLRPGQDECDVTPAEHVRAVPDLWSLTLNFPTDAGRIHRFQNIVDLAGKVPVWNITRPAGYDRLGEVVDRIVSAARRLP